jgi:hypothetical protein
LRHYQGLREHASLLVAEGYDRTCVWTMPLGMLWSEAILARRRVRQNAVLNAVLIHAAIVDAIGGGGHLRQVIEGIVDE